MSFNYPVYNQALENRVSRKFFFLLSKPSQYSPVGNARFLWNAGSRQQISCLLPIYELLIIHCSPAFSWWKTIRKSALFRVRANFEPLSASLQDSIRFFQPPIPACLWPALAGRFPHLRRQSGLPCSTDFTRWLRICLSAGGFIDCGERKRSAPSITLTFWSKPVSIFGFLSLTTFISSSHMLSISSFLAPDLVWCSQI